MYNLVMKLIKKIISLLLVICLCGCSGKSESSVRSLYSYTIYPIGYLLNKIGGNRINTTTVQSSTVVQNSTLNEDYELNLNNSLYLYYINGLEPYMSVFANKIKDTGVELVDLSGSSIYAFKRFTPTNTNGVINFVESNYYDGEAFDTIDIYNDDLFIWLDPIGMLSMAKEIYNHLSSNYAEASAYFETNYKALEADLITLDAAYQNLASRLQKENKAIKFVSMTPSFGSWQKAYGIEVYPICLSKYGALPTESQLKVIKDRIVADGVKYIAYEPNMTSDMTNLFMTLETDLGLKRVNLSNLSSLTVTQQADSKDYLTIMYDNLAVLENIATDEETEFSEVEDLESIEVVE